VSESLHARLVIITSSRIPAVPVGGILPYIGHEPNNWAPALFSLCKAVVAIPLNLVSKGDTSGNPVTLSSGLAEYNVI